jgi:hypothetical protein
MRHQPRIRKFRRTLKVEALEDRTLLSGVVYASEDMTTGLLSITASTGNKDVTIVQVSPDDLRVSGVFTPPSLTTPPDFTSVNGGLYADFALHTVTGINIQMPDGNDQVALSSFDLNGNLIINASPGTNTFTLNTIHANAITISAAGPGGDTVSMNTVTAGGATIATGTGADQINLDSVAMGFLNINSGSGTANDSITITNSFRTAPLPAAIGLLTVNAGDGDNTIGVTDTTLGLATITAGVGSNTVDVSNDLITVQVPLNLNVGLGGSAVQTVSLNNDTFSGGPANIAIGDGTPLFYPGSSLTMTNDTGIGAAVITLGQYFQSVTIGNDQPAGNITAGTLNVAVGDNSDNVQINANVAGAESVTVGSAGILSPPSLTVGGSVGTPDNPQPLDVQAGDNWTVTVGATVSGDENINPSNASNGDSITVKSPSVGGDLSIQAGDNTPSLDVLGTTTNNLTIQAGTGNTYFVLSDVTVNNDLNLTTGDGDNALAMMNVNVVDALWVTCGAGINVVYTQSVTCLYGVIDGGSGSSNDYEGSGYEAGFVTIGFAGSVVFDPPQIDPSQLSLSADSINEGDTATLNGSFTQFNNDAPHTVTIDWGDGSASIQLQLAPDVFTFSVPHQYVLAGDDSITVTVTDNLGYSASAQTPITIHEVPPVIPTGGLKLSASTIDEGGSVALTGNFIDPGTMDTHTVDINWGDGSADNTVRLAAGVLTFGPVSHNYLNNLPGNAPYTIQVTVTDQNDASGSGSIPLVVDNVAPANLQLGFAKDPINQGDTATLNGSFTDPGVLDTHTVVINWGDGSATTTLNLAANVLNFTANHPYQDGRPNNDPYTVQVTVTDDDNASVSTSSQFLVNNLPPANIQLGFASNPINEGDTAILNGTFTDVNPQDTHTVDINWGDGSAGTTLSLGAGALTFVANHRYLDELPGNAPYTVQVTVADPDNASTSASIPLTVNNATPSNLQLSFANTSISEGDTAMLNGSFTDPGVLDTHTVVINWGDGSATTTLNLAANVLNFTANHPYVSSLPDDAPYTVQVTVTDEENASTSAAITLNVNTVNPTLTLSGPSTGNPESPYALNLSASTPNGTPVTSWTINWGDGTTEPVSGNPSSVAHSYALVHHTYTISAEATTAGGTFAAGNTVTVKMSLATDNENWVAQVYEDVLNRAPELAGLNNWTAHLAAGASREQVVQGILVSPEYRTLTVNGIYEQYLGRPADAQGLQQDVQALNAGTTTDQIRADILGSDEYFSLRASNTTSGYVAALYHDVLNRSGTASEVQSWVETQSADGGRIPLAMTFLTSTEANQVLVQGYYQKFLHRAADASGLSTFVQARANGATEEDVMAAILASDEYFTNAVA